MNYAARTCADQLNDAELEVQTLRAALADALQRAETVGAAHDGKERQLQAMTTAADELQDRLKARHYSGPKHLAFPSASSSAAPPQNLIMWLPTGVLGRCWQDRSVCVLIPWTAPGPRREPRCLAFGNLANLNRTLHLSDK